MEKKVKLTSVNILEDVYKKFKVISIDQSINLQKVVNRALDLYNNNEEFRNKINNHNTLSTKDSKF